jgi:hypothetical protein
MRDLETSSVLIVSTLRRGINPPLMIPSDFLESESKLEGSVRRVHVSSLWGVLLEGLALVWPARHSIGGVQLGDVWPCSALTTDGQAEGDDFVPFHKLTGWITYSLIEPMEKILKWRFEGIDDMTGLPEYRNGTLGIPSLDTAIDFCSRRFTDRFWHSYPKTHSSITCKHWRCPVPSPFTWCCS